MESVRALYNEDCDFLNKMFLINEEAELWRNSEAVNVNANFTFFDESLFSSSEYFDPSFCFSQEHANICNASDNYSACFPNVSLQASHFCDSDLVHVTNDISESMFFGAMDKPNNAPAQYLPNDHVMHDVLNMKAEMGLENITDLGNKRKFEVPQVVANVENPKKKCCVPRDIPKCKKNVQAKRNKSVNIDEEGTYNSSNGHSSSSNSSEDDSNASHERSILDSKGSEVLDSCKKPRAGRGAATDPQSLYARKRREKINERLRILQNLVPNGTKVDISTMLEEAVHYVNFLQLQIKLLSSDEKWMYAPIAYNGMNMGLY